MRGVGPKLKARGAQQRSDAPPADDLDDIFAPDPQAGDDPEFEQGVDSDMGPDTDAPHRSASPPSSLRLRRALRRAGATRLLQDGTLPAGAHEALEPPPLPQLEYKPATRKKPAKAKTRRRSDWRIGLVAATAGILWGSGLAYLAYSYLTGNTPLTLTTAAPAPVPLPTESTVAKSTETVVTENAEPEESEPLPLPVAPPDNETDGGTEASQPPAETAASGEAPAAEAELTQPLPLPPPPPPAPASSSVAETQSTVPQAPEIISPPSSSGQSTLQQVAAAPAEPPDEAASETKNQEVALQSPSLGERTSPNTILDCEGCPKLVQLPAGEFQMGSQSSEANHQPDESPLHPVRFTKPFAISAYEVTFEEWDACVKDKGCSQSPSDEGWGRGRNPVINVSWEDVTTQYLPWLSKKTGHAYRLPTEAEWEYAARAAATGDNQAAFAFGNDSNTLCAYGNGADATLQQANGGGEGLSCSDGHAQTAAVGSFKPNAFGLYDTHGNVWEWVEDCWNDSYDGAAPDGTARTTGDCSTRVLRGGSWNSDFANLRTAARGWNRSGGRKDSIGFRVVRDD